MLIGSLLAWGIFTYYSKTKAIPAYGGEYIEGIVGQPQHINPVLSLSNNTDDDISQLIYSSLMKYDENGNLINDVADSYEISDDKTFYTFHLKNNVLWHDGQNLTTQDIFFTVNLITDPSYKSPKLLIHVTEPYISNVSYPKAEYLYGEEPAPVQFSLPVLLKLKVTVALLSNESALNIIVSCGNGTLSEAI
jgi:ABC-type transport system substrate-binding protein